MRILLDPNPAEGGSPKPITNTPKSNLPTPIKVVEQAHTPPPEVLKQEFKMDDGLFDSKPEEGRTIIQDKSGLEKEAKLVKPEGETEVVEAKEKAPAIREEKKEEPEEKQEEKKPSFLKPPVEKKEEKQKAEVKQVVPKEKQARDLTGFSEEEASHLRQMSNAAFEFTAKLIKEKKELEKSKDNTFLQHPDAYTLSPQYKELSSKTTLAQREGEYWTACLEQLEQGNPIRDLNGWNADGTPVLGTEYKPTTRLVEQVRLAMSNAYNIAQQSAKELQAYPQQFKTNIQKDLGTIQEERAKRFAWVADPKFLDYTLDMGDGNEVPIKEIRKNFIDWFPPYLQSNPATEAAADLFVAFRIQSLELEQARNGQKTAEVKQEEIKRGEPSSSTKPGKQPDAINGVREFTLAGLPSN